MQITVRSLNHRYIQRQIRLQALQEINLEIHEGEFVALIGPSGCGKSTLLRILSGLLEPTSGTVLLGEQPPQALAAAKRIGWLSQNPALLPWKTVQENIALAQKINPQNHRTLLSVPALLDLVNLRDFAEAYPFTLSGGMQQRAALARTLALGADLWLMDEPFAALDEITREALIAELLQLWQQFRPTVVWVTHHIYEAVRLADRVLVMTPRPGQITAEVDISQPRPRVENQPGFLSTVSQIRSSLQMTGMRNRGQSKGEL